MRKPAALVATTSLIVIAMLLAGCGLLSRPKTPPTNQYRISPTLTNRHAPSGTCNRVLAVRAISASTPWATDNMLYTQTRHSLESYAYHQWAADPATMLTSALVEALDASGLYRGVLGPLGSGSSDLTLAVTLVKGPLQIFSGKSQANAAKAGQHVASATSREKLVLAATLSDAQSGDLVASKTFSAEKDAAPNPYGGVVATNALAGKLIGQMRDWLAQTNSTIEGCAGK